MKLYHGCSWSAATRIVDDGEGIRVRGRRKGNFSHTVNSCPHAVYLTDTYPVYFAAASMASSGPLANKAAVIEIDTYLLDMPDLMLNADEDVLEQAGRGHDGLPEDWDMKRRTLYYRNRLTKYRWPWEQSLKAMGTCTYMGDIPVEAITRVAWLDFSDMQHIAIWAMDAQISLMNFRLCKSKHKALVSWIFDEELADEEKPVVHDIKNEQGETLHYFQEFSWPPHDDRSGIKLVDYRAEVAFRP